MVAGDEAASAAKGASGLSTSQQCSANRQHPAIHFAVTSGHIDVVSAIPAAVDDLAGGVGGDGGFVSGLARGGSGVVAGLPPNVDDDAVIQVIWDRCQAN